MTTDPPESLPFAVWLQAAAAEAGAADASELAEVLVTNGCYCRGATVASWLDGTSEPPPEKARLILGALNKAVGDFDVWEQYGRWKEGEAFFQHNEATGGHEPPADLLQTIKAGGLPPPLEG